MIWRPKSKLGPPARTAISGPPGSLTAVVSFLSRFLSITFHFPTVQLLFGRQVAAWGAQSTGPVRDPRSQKFRQLSPSGIKSFLFRQFGKIFSSFLALLAVLAGGLGSLGLPSHFRPCPLSACWARCLLSRRFDPSFFIHPSRLPSLSRHDPRHLILKIWENSHEAYGYSCKPANPRCPESGWKPGPC